ncbi:MAG TPA: hypothetical protein VEX37_00875 [Thermomicrobiales bacterium]|nr:hypothetical protein [Thermomicrobiales bacterium]
MTTSPHDGTRIKPLIPAMRWLLFIAGLLVLGAGNSLFLFSSQTDEYFAWTIGNPLTAAFLGAAFWSSCALEVLSAREYAWSRARLAVPAVLIFTILTAIATMIHRDIFHDTWIAWTWIGVYLIVPPVFMVVLGMQLREPGVDEPRQFPLPGWLRVMSAVQGVILLGAGSALMVAPLDAMRIWPWPLTELTARSIGAWLIGLGVIALQAAWENDFLRIRAGAVAALLLVVLQSVALIRYPDTVDFSSVEGVIYLIALVNVAVVGIISVNGYLRATRAQPQTTPVTAS